MRDSVPSVTYSSVCNVLRLWRISVIPTYTRTQNHFNKMKKEVGMLLQKSTDTRGVGISSMRKSIYLLKTTPSSHTHTFHPLSTIVIHTLNFAQVKSMDDNCGEWVECMGVASGCGEQEVGVASGNGWNLWVWLLGVVLRRYIDFLILLIPTPLVSVLFCSSTPTSFFILLK